MQKLVQIVRLADGRAYTGLVLEDTETNRRAIDRDSLFLMSKPLIVAIEVKLESGRQAGYVRSGRGLF